MNKVNNFHPALRLLSIVIAVGITAAMTTPLLSMAAQIIA